jgi:hypothetical protein
LFHSNCGEQLPAEPIDIRSLCSPLNRVVGAARGGIELRERESSFAMELHVMKHGVYVKNCETLHLSQLIPFVVRTIKEQFDLFNSALEWEEEKESFIKLIVPMISGQVKITQFFRESFPFTLVMGVAVKYFTIEWIYGVGPRPPPVLSEEGGFTKEELLQNSSHRLTNKIRQQMYVSLGNVQIPGHYLSF